MRLFNRNVFNYATIKFVSFINKFIGTLADVEIEKNITHNLSKKGVVPLSHSCTCPLCYNENVIYCNTISQFLNCALFEIIIIKKKMARLSKE